MTVIYHVLVYRRNMIRLMTIGLSLELKAMVGPGAPAIHLVGCGRKIIWRSITTV